VLQAPVRTAAVPPVLPKLVVRVQLHWQKLVAYSAEAADVLIALIAPSAVLALIVGLWRLSEDLGWTGAFPVSQGFFSHWQVWIALAIGLKFGGSALAAKMTPAENSSAPNQKSRVKTKLF